MSDITLVWDPATARGDWATANGDLLSGNDLQTAIYISIFSDARLPDDQVPPDGTDDPRGWWADTYEESPTGSLLWTLERAVISNGPAFLAQVKQIVSSAVQWLIDDEVAASITVETWWIATASVGIYGVVTEPDGTTQSFQYAWAWKGIS